jgi:5'-nucleotidase/UDP-sugar diphosphatase
VGRDYRIGLVAGSILAGVALLWVATRPGLSPQPQPVQSPQDNDRDLPAVGRPVNPGSASEANEPGRLKTEDTGQKTQDGPASQAVPGIPSSGSSDLTSPEKTEPSKTPRFHVVRQGETLSAIAQQYYGSANDWRKILAANEKTIKDANKIAPGTKLIIPE